MSETVTRRWLVSEELVRAYSRRGNYHSEPALSAGLNLPGLVAQGMQAAGPAYGVLLDGWGETFLESGEIDMRFVGLVLADDIVEAKAAIDDDSATFEVVNTSAGRTAVIGHARRNTDA